LTKPPTEGVGGSFVLASFPGCQVVTMMSKSDDLCCEPSDLVLALATMSRKWKVRILCLLLDGNQLPQQSYAGWRSYGTSQR
jgi:hypothetical protein